MILYRDKCLAVYKKAIGEDSEKLNLPDDMKGYNTLTRLDKPVSGILVLRPSKAPGKLSTEDVEKRYIAVVSGRMEASEGQLRDLLYHDKRNNKTFPVKRMRNGVKEAILDYQELEYNSEKDISLISIKLTTGRTHQIRVQFASRKHPLFGDGKYGSRFKGLPALCCNYVKFIHPTKNSPMVYEMLPEGEPWNYFDFIINQEYKD